MKKRLIWSVSLLVAVASLDTIHSYHTLQHYMMVLAFGGCRVGLAAGEGIALAEHWVKGEPASLVSGQ